MVLATGIASNYKKTHLFKLELSPLLIFEPLFKHYISVHLLIFDEKNFFLIFILIFDDIRTVRQNMLILP